ncbi:phosphatase 2C-like domain-containing protein [Coniochaeta sp. 2T2.1]|nr:phosphatase 2C-like domain-containing protein [Coniochaeta sp. 2T2.1]
MDAFMGYISTFFHGQPRQRASFTSTTRFIITPGSEAGELSQPSPSPRHPATPNAQRHFHNYFVTHLPSSSLHPDSRSSSGPHHKLPRSASTPHTQGPGAAPAVVPPNMPSRDLTVVRIPLRSAKHHFGAYESRGSRSYNEDTNQAGTIDMPAFAKRTPTSFSRGRMPRPNDGEGTSADSALGDPQIFYFGVFDGHGGSECSEFLRDELHGYIEEAAAEFELGSSLRGKQSGSLSDPRPSPPKSRAGNGVKMAGAEVQTEMNLPAVEVGGVVDEAPKQPLLESEAPVPSKADACKAVFLEKNLVEEYKNLVGGYFRRFKPQYFDIPDSRSTSDPDFGHGNTGKDCKDTTVTLESVLTYAFLRADLDFITAQARKPDRDDPYADDHPLNKDEVLGKPSHIPPSGHNTIGGPARFKGGSTASVALISTPTPAPFWHPSASSTMVVAHVGDTRILLCETATGLARPLTSDHHPSSPVESRRLRRFAGSVITDSFGEERITGLANSRAFGDMQSKRIGVSAEPEITRVDLGPGQYSFLVLVSDGVSGTLSDQEIVDVIKEAKTPEEGAKRVVDYATEISSDGDNATCLVVRLGGWERRSEGGVGSLGTKEIRDIRRAEASDPRRGRR